MGERMDIDHGRHCGINKKTLTNGIQASTIPYRNLGITEG